MKGTPSGGDSSRRLLSALGIVVVVVIAFLLGRVSSDEPVPLKPEAKTAPNTGPGPTREVNGVPVGYAQTEEGAVAAAANFALLAADDSLRDQRRFVRALQLLAAPEWTQEAKTQAVKGFDFLVSRYGSDGDLAGAVLGYDVTEFSPDEAVIRLWTVSVVSGSKRPTVEEVWSISTVTLEWIEGDWRVAGAETSPGPPPVDLPSASSPLSAQEVMEVFDEFGGPTLP